MWHRKEIITWRDTRKANEIATLGQFGPLRIFVPSDCEVTIENPLSEYENVEITSYDDIFDNLSKEHINIMSIEPFLLDPLQWLRFWSLFFETLVHKAVKKKLKVPMSCFFDEFNQLAPSRHLPIGKNQVRMTAWIARNMETLRATKVRIIAASHGVKKLEKAIRDSFMAHFYKRTMGKLGGDIQALKTTTVRIENLRLDQVVFLTIGKYYSDPVKVKNYNVGKICANAVVDYEGEVSYDWMPFSEYPDPFAPRRPRRTNGELIQIFKDHFNLTDEQIGEALGVSRPVVTRMRNHY